MKKIWRCIYIILVDICCKSCFNRGIYMDISTKHKSVKSNDYWDNLTSGTTSQYKEKIIEDLIISHFPSSCKSILDIGCGTCNTALKYKKKLNANEVTFLDYDENVIAKLKKENDDKKGINWIVADIFMIRKMDEKYDLVFFLDMLHEVYSFFGRGNTDLEKEVNHNIGISYVIKALENVSQLVNSGGGIIITDDILCSEDFDICLRVKNDRANKCIKYFFNHYMSKKIRYNFIKKDMVIINSKDLCILLTQYNKIKSDDLERWNVEKHEIHQYMTIEQYRETLNNLGFTTYEVMGTPKPAYDEWHEDFEIISGLTDFPKKRITLLAIKNKPVILP